MSQQPAIRRSEDIDVLAAIIAKLKFRDVQRQIFLADLVIGADNAALQDAPKAFNRVGVNRADNVVAAALADNPVRQIAAEQPISRMLINVGERASKTNP